MFSLSNSQLIFVITNGEWLDRRRKKFWRGNHLPSRHDENRVGGRITLRWRRKYDLNVTGFSGSCPETGFVLTVLNLVVIGNCQRV
jgi:hypothetical protein